MLSYINLFSLHYFLWFSALTSIYGYISVYAKHYANASSSQYGLLNMILPFVTIGSKIFFCSLADRHRAYRLFFIAFLISSLIGYGSFGIMPFFIEAPLEESTLNHKAWAMICVMTSIATISMSVISCLSDAFAMNSSKKSGTSYGLIRSWGTIGWGVSALILAFINQTKKLPLLVPGLLMTIALLLLDIFAAIFWPYKDDFKLDKSCSHVDVEDVIEVLSNVRVGNQTDQLETRTVPRHYGSSGSPEQDSTIAKTQVANKSKIKMMTDVSSVKIQWMLFKEIAKRRRSIFRYMILFTISGALISLQWSYFFLYLEEIYKDDFSFISGLSMVGQSMLGELPFFLISQSVIQVLGRSYTLSISILSIGFRYILYRYLLPNASMYFVLLTESFQGPSFGLFYVVLTEVGLDYSDCEEAIVVSIEKGVIENDAGQIQKLRQALRATMQSLMSACYEGLGLGIGSIIGGLVIDNYGFEVLWTYSAMIATVLGLVNVLVEIFGLEALSDRKPRVAIKI